MTPDPVDTSAHVEMAVIVERLKHIQTSIEEMRSDIRTQQQQYLPRAEWEVWSLSRDREIREMKDRDKSRVAVWTSVGAVILAGVSGLIGLVQALQ